MPKITYPYMPSGKTILYVPASNQYMLAAKKEAREHSLDSAVPTGSVIVAHGKVVAAGANGSDYHKTHPCQRVLLGIPTGQGYELCEGCNTKNHSEAQAVENARAAGINIAGADLYLWGHWWCCEPCWQAIVSAGINNVYLIEGSEVLFNKENPANILPKHIPGGLFIVLEGGEGAGKTTVAAALQAKLVAQGYETVVTREPGATALGERLRPILFDPHLGKDKLDGYESLLLFSADRHAHIREVIKPALAAGKILISDRYMHSTKVYQLAEGGDEAAIDTITQLTINGLVPTRTYWFDLPPEVGLDRITRQHRQEVSKNDTAKLAFHKRIHQEFRRLQEHDSQHIHRIDAQLPLETVIAAVYADILRLISDKLHS